MTMHPFWKLFIYFCHVIEGTMKHFQMQWHFLEWNHFKNWDNQPLPQNYILQLEASGVEVGWPKKETNNQPVAVCKNIGNNQPVAVCKKIINNKLKCMPSQRLSIENRKGILEAIPDVAMPMALVAVIASSILFLPVGMAVAVVASVSTDLLLQHHSSPLYHWSHHYCPW